MPDPAYERIRRELRRELEVRQLRDTVWTDLCHQGLVEQVRRAQLPLSELVRRYRNQEEIYHREKRTRRARRRMPPDRRNEALTQIVAFRLDWLQPAVILFRDQNLDGRHLTLEEVPDWIRQQAAREGKPATALLCVPVAGYGEYPAGSRAERRQWYLDWLAREAARITADPDGELPASQTADRLTLDFQVDHQRSEQIAIRSDGVLAALKRLAADRELRSAGWGEAEAVTFILTENIPWVPLASSAYEHAVVPNASHITLSVSPRLAPQEVARFYAQARGRVMHGRDRPFGNDKPLALAVFVEETRLAGHGWLELREQWNARYEERHPEWRSGPAADPAARRFALEARSAWRTVTGSTWTDRRRWSRSAGARRTSS